MKKKLSTLAVAACMLLTGCGTMGMNGANGTGGGNILGGILGAITGGTGVVDAITSVIGLDKLTAEQLIGTWTYAGPGCAFTSENLLAKAGGEVAASQIEQKLLPTYQKLGFSSSNTFITFNTDRTFVAKIDGQNFSGNYTFDEAKCKLTLQGMILSINCYAKRELKGISILFEAKKLLTLIQTMSALSGNANLETIGELSKNYDGVRLGFDMSR
ncbi:MAG: DUF4923 family protein [Prevotella sp.]|nr:DUF4923 family protein [Prevotella sp.]